MSEKEERARKARLKRQIKKEITELNKQREELFAQWIFKKAIYEEFVRKEGARVYLEMKQLQAKHDAV
ncbi:MAG: hypothetical protein J6J74_07330 [Elusimicrobiaceae bacterium]|nr:hypothetical protein [Elusimicrobiaceae bacterium]